MLRIAVCDDMPRFLTETKALAQQWENRPDGMTVSLFQDADALLEAHSAAPFDIIFLDVVMPLLNGIQAAGEIRRRDKAVKIVFLSHSPEYALDSYTVKADDYLLKPVDRERFFACLDDCYTELLEHARCVAVKTHAGIRRIRLQDIESVEAQGKRVVFTLTDGSFVETAEPLYAYENGLPPGDGFFKCHRSYIVNLYKIHTYTAKEITMRSGSRIPIARSCQKTFEEAYFSLMFGRADEL